jgi:hypothetical protein
MGREVIAVQKNAIVATSQPQASPVEQIIRKWLVVFGSLFNQDITPLLISSWCKLLSDIEPDRLESAFTEAAKTVRAGFPKPGDIRAQLEAAATTGSKLKAEEEWQKVYRVATEFWHPDIGLYPNAPQLSPATSAALRAPGGLFHIFKCSRDELQWTRKRFIDHFLLVAATGKIEHLLADAEAKKILSRFSKSTPNSRLPAQSLPRNVNTPAEVLKDGLATDPVTQANDTVPASHHRATSGQHEEKTRPRSDHNENSLHDQRPRRGKATIKEAQQ